MSGRRLKILSFLYFKTILYAKKAEIGKSSIFSLKVIVLLTVLYKKYRKIQITVKYFRLLIVLGGELVLHRTRWRRRRRREPLLAERAEGAAVVALVVVKEPPTRRRTGGFHKSINIIHMYWCKLVVVGAAAGAAARVVSEDQAANCVLNYFLSERVLLEPFLPAAKP